ncbi:Uncharacterized protein APZ42_026069 [Daphnia magna]|uniref:Uncharacterized protein n=1 Tax=Daphnia magna TaxID=35525 RepID=A0A164SIJ8_9CRUS|nr:Uncharacterized protein APZ42_026069 [Daphnia magna]
MVQSVTLERNPGHAPSARLTFTLRENKRRRQFRSANADGQTKVMRDGRDTCKRLDALYYIR